jgi:1-acyl-sn-glycerol-3-phosphate acyltransferase
MTEPGGIGNGGSGRRATRRPPGRIAPEALAAARGGAVEGLDWLGRPPEATADLFVRCISVLARLVLFGFFRFRIDIAGRELLPRTGGYLVIAAAHRGWMDPFLVLCTLPLEPRVWFLGSGPSAFGPRWREALLHRLGGLLPVWRGGVGVEQHVSAARTVIANGAVLAQMPEGTVSGPVGRIGPFRIGAALIALRTGAPLVLLAMAGTEELYVGRRMAVRVLPPTTAAELLGDAWDGTLPAERSRAELDLARELSAIFEAQLGPVVAALHPGTVDSPDRPRRLRERLTWLLLRRGRLDRADPADPADPPGPPGAPDPSAGPAAPAHARILGRDEVRRDDP